MPTSDLTAGSGSGSGNLMRFCGRTDRPHLSCAMAPIASAAGMRPNGTIAHNSPKSTEILYGACLRLTGQPSLSPATYLESSGEYPLIHIGRLDQALDLAATRGWVVVSMKDDLRTILAEAPK
jgi:hypothetical protein